LLLRNGNDARQASHHMMCEEEHGKGIIRLYSHGRSVLPQGKQTESCDEDKAYLTLEKNVHNCRKVGYYFRGVE